MMALIQAAIALIVRYTGRIINTAISWATVLLFGKVPHKRQIYLSIMSFLSIFWLIFVIGIASPSTGTFLLAFMRVPQWMDKNIVRLIMLTSAALFPLIIGVLSILVIDPALRPKGKKELARLVLKGYPYTAGLSLTLAMMVLFAPIIKIRAMLKNWSNTHIPVIIDSKSYMQAVNRIDEILDGGGIKVDQIEASWMIRLPTRFLAACADNSLHTFMAKQLTTLRAKNLEIMIHPSTLR